MNEEQKNIETCLPEDVLSEVANVPTDPQFVSLTDEALDPLKRQALQQAGYDGYEKVVWTHKPYTFTSQVKQMKSNLILLLRCLWRFPFGRGTTASSAAGSSAASATAPIRSLADMWQHYITRLKGNPEYGIPSRLSQLTDLPSAPALLADRKIGGCDLADGISIVNLMCSANSEVTELYDNNKWGKLSHTSSVTFNPIWSIFPNLKKLAVGCTEYSLRTYPKVPIERNRKIEELEFPYCETIEEGAGGIARQCSNLRSIKLPSLKTLYSGWYTNHSYDGLVVECPSVVKVELPSLEKFENRQLSGSYNCVMYNDSGLKELLMPKLSVMYSNDSGTRFLACICPAIEKLQVGKLIQQKDVDFVDSNCKNLLHLELGTGTECSVNLRYWKPTTALSDNLQQFLSNFKTYIAERLTDKGTGLTLTLSQEVRNAIHAAEDEYGIENIIITQKGWTISPAPN